MIQIIIFKFLNIYIKFELKNNHEISKIRPKNLQYIKNIINLGFNRLKLSTHFFLVFFLVQNQKTKNASFFGQTKKLTTLI